MNHDLELLLSLHGETFVFEGGYRVKYVAHKVPVTSAKPHGVDYSLTLHAPNGKRLLGFDNAHVVYECCEAGRRFSSAGRPSWSNEE
jgi:hypothetical protein